MSQTELIMKIYKSLRVAVHGEADECFFAAGIEILEWLDEEIPEEIRDELDAEALHDMTFCICCDELFEECEC